MRSWTRLLVLVVLAGLLAAPAAAQEPIRIGVNLEMTGSVAAYGQMGWEGLQVIRSLGYDKVLGRPVELVLVDNKSDKVEAANATTRLINQGVVAIVGTMISGNLLAAGPIAEEAGIPIIGPSTTNPLVTQGRSYVFRACFTDTYQAVIAAQFAYENLGARRAAVISDIAQDYTVALGKYFTQQFEKLGGKVVATTYVRTGDQDFTAQLTAVANANPDLLYVPNYYTEDALIARQARELGLTQPILSGDGADAPELLEIGGKAVEGLMHTAFWHEEAAVTDLGRQYIDAYRAKYNRAPNSFGGLTADAYLMLLHAIEKAGKPDPKLIREQLEAIDGLEVVTGPVIVENGDAIKPVVIRRVADGDFRYMATVFPPELKAYANK
ncbi:ABC transporter substrate-binding protein [Limnochorda pilosa]|uniref:Branched-chain amino acid ABC transporter substrate-binding protein n=1 Tax=Limnochorda pilosa TaxID=1555112 RepID=A0A0K2SKX0_LIMPI|nr:ABC transporter substrate-binding protein [Limnochorda pilosa]BAS27758.1 branched-chain amino acid ABC transporter substrate-binding protein [Limnochorda pilosa]